MEAPPYAVRRLAEPSDERSRVLSLLSEESLPSDVALSVADPDTLVAMAQLHRTLKSCLSPAHVKNKNSWVTTSKLCARKRPDLFPVRDSVVCRYLGIGQNFEVDWQVFRHIMRDESVIQKLDQLVAAAAKQDGTDVGNPNRRLKHLDTLLWMHARADHS